MPRARVGIDIDADPAPPLLHVRLPVPVEPLTAPRAPAPDVPVVPAPPVVPTVPAIPVSGGGIVPVVVPVVPDTPVLGGGAGGETAVSGTHPGSASVASASPMTDTIAHARFTCSC